MITHLDCTVTILQGRDLVAKDRNLWGKKTTSDPYVEVWAVSPSKDNSTPRTKDMATAKAHKVGQTDIQYKTLNPKWNNEHFSHSFVLGKKKQNTTTAVGAGSCTMQLKIWDYDQFSAPDAMGMVTLDIPCHEVECTQWLPVPSTSARNASGELLVHWHVAPRETTTLVRGNAFALTTARQRQQKIQVGLAWDLIRGCQSVDLDVSCVAVNNDGQVCLQDCVYYGNKQNSNESVVHSGDEQDGDKDGDDESITFFMDRIPSRILAMHIVLTVATPGMTIADIQSTVLSIYGWNNNNDERSKTTLCTFTPALRGQNSTAMFLVRLARTSSDPNAAWTCQPIHDTHPTARDFGSLIPHIKAYTRDLIPHIVVDPTERIAVMRKGGNINLTEYTPGGTVPEVLTFGLAWDVTNGVNIDLDASIVCLDKNLSVVDTISFRQLTSKDGSIKHHGDEREGDEEGDDEQIDIFLSRVQRQVEYLVLVINSYSGQELDDVDRATCHLFDQSTKIDVASYALTNSKSLDGYTALIVGCLYRGDRPGDWCLSIISEAGIGRTVEHNISQLQRHLRNHRPTPPNYKQEQEIVVRMPSFTPLALPESQAKPKGTPGAPPAGVMPKKYIQINGVTKINPDYKKWREVNS